MPRTQILAEPGVPQVVISREFAARAELLLRAHTEARLLEQWLGPRRLPLSVDCLDPRHGGCWRFTHHDTEGHAFSFHGVYHGAPSIAGIVQTWELEAAPGHVSLNTVTFEQHGAGTLLRQNTVFQSVEDRDFYVDSGMDEGVQESMDRLDALVTRLSREGLTYAARG